MRRELAKRRRRSCFWALHFALDDARLSRDGRQGLEWAQKLARDDLERRQQARRWEEVMPQWRIDEFAEFVGEEEWHPISPSTVHAKIRTARLELFGNADLSDSAMHYRIRQRKKGVVRREHCAEEGCNNPLPRAATAKRRYCPAHTTSRAKVRRHRARRAQQPRRMAVDVPP
jgi:hypothetical protein